MMNRTIAVRLSTRRWTAAPLCARRLLLLLGLGLGSWGCSEGDPSQEGDMTGVGGDTAVQEESREGTVVIAPSSDCEVPDVSGVVLEGQVHRRTLPFEVGLFSWTIPEQEELLRTDRVLLTVGEVPGKGKGVAMDLLSERATAEPHSFEAAINGIFSKFRYAWTNPWATRIGPGSEDYGNRLIKMALREDAWLAELAADGTIASVWDRTGDLIPLAEAALTPERIAALYFVRRDGSGGPFCGTFAGATGGYREYIVGNEAMLEQWSVGTEEIRARLEEDIVVLEEYAERVSSCPPVSFRQARTFNVTVTCHWRLDSGYQDPYFGSLALPSDAYLPTAENLDHLVDLLRSDLFEPDPLVVTPQ